MFIRILRKLDYWIGSLSEHLLLICGTMILLMAFLATFGVIMRHIFDPEPYSYEFSYMFLLFSGVLAVAGVEKLDQHVRNDLLASRFPNTMKIIIINIISPLLAMAFCTVLIWKSMDNALYALDIGQTSQSTWRIPIAPVKFFIPAGFILLQIILFSKFVKGINLLLRGGKGPEEGTDTG
ncbi:MAG TPA: TRAP transporter small permease subunit [Dehalococcoidia bacterium]|nr:TRAP transporter small permease subunit [Dehalococcoidia bacterium]